MKRAGLFFFLLVVLLSLSCTQQTSPPRGTSINAPQEQKSEPPIKRPSYGIFKGQDFSFRYPGGWTISSQKRFFARGFGTVSVNNFNYEGFWPGTHSNRDGGSSWSPEIAQLQVPTDGAFLMIWILEGPGGIDNLPDKLDKTSLKHTSKAKGPTEAYSLIFQSGGTQYRLDLFLNGRAIANSKKEALAIIDSLKLEPRRQGSAKPVPEAVTIPQKVEANGIYELITEDPVIFSENATRYGGQPLVDIEALSSTDKYFSWTILDINPGGVVPGQPQYLKFRIKVTDFNQPHTIRFKIRPRNI